MAKLLLIASNKISEVLSMPLHTDSQSDRQTDRQLNKVYTKKMVIVFDQHKETFCGFILDISIFSISVWSLYVIICKMLDY